MDCCEQDIGTWRSVMGCCEQDIGTWRSVMDCCEQDIGTWRSVMGCCVQDTAIFVCHEWRGMCCKYWVTGNFSRSALLRPFVCPLPYIVPADLMIFVTVTPWRHEKYVSGQLQVSSNLLPLRDRLTQTLSEHIAWETSAMTPLGFESPIV